MKKAKKCTILERLLEEGYFADEKEAGSWVMMKKVLVNDQPVWSLHEKVPADGVIRIKEFYKKQYVNKGGFKLEAAISKFHIHAEDRVVLDCGASTGGFTDCWLQHGAKLVYAVDAGFGQLAGKLAADSRVVNMEKTNLSDEKLVTLEPRPEMISLDLSYLSLKKALPVCRAILGDKGLMICLIKPIYEVESSEIRRNGDINQRPILTQILTDLCRFYLESGLEILGITNSPVRGNSGTLEYLIAVSWEGKDPAEPLRNCAEGEAGGSTASGVQAEQDPALELQSDTFEMKLQKYRQQIEEALDASFLLEEFKKK